MRVAFAMGGIAVAQETRDAKASGIIIGAAAMNGGEGRVKSAAGVLAFGGRGVFEKPANKVGKDFAA